MLLGALVDVGLPAETLVGLPRRLGLDDVEVRVARARRGALDAARVEVLVEGRDPDLPPDEGGAPGTPDRGHGRHLADVRAKLESADLPEAAREKAGAVFAALYEAEARVHGRPVEEVHLHEAGANDALIDICGACLGIVELGVEEVSCATPIPLGGGTVRCAHGVLPVPVPAVAALLEGVPVVGGPGRRELVTPTGAAMLRALVTRWGAAPAMTLEASGHGAGRRDDPERPNVLRALVGRVSTAGEARRRRIAVIETTLDDVVPQDVPVLVERLIEAGARDAHVVPVQMKKGRPGFLVRAVCDPERSAELARLLLHESPTLGVRIDEQDRLEWERDTISVATPWGPVRVKRAREAGGRVVRGQAEFEDCRHAAEARGEPIDRVRRAAHAEFDGRETDEEERRGE